MRFRGLTHHRLPQLILFALISGIVALAPACSPFKKKSVASAKFLPGITLSWEKSLVSVESAVVPAGTTIKIRGEVKDQYGLLYKGPIDDFEMAISGGSSTGVLSEPERLEDGAFEATFRGQIAGTPTTVSATLNGKPLLSTFPRITVVASGFSRAQSTVSSSATTVASGSTATLTLTLRDELGNIVTNDSPNIVFSYSGGTSTGNISSTTDNQNGTFTATLTALTAGTPSTVTATINGQPITSEGVSVRVVPGNGSGATSTLSLSSSSIRSGETATVILTSHDAGGNRITKGGESVSFALSGGTSTATIGAVTDHGDGTYSAVLTGAIAGTTSTVNARINGNSLTSTLPLLTVSPGDPSLANTTVTLSQATIASGSSVTATVTVRDALNNALTTGGRTVAFSATGGTSTVTISGLTDHQNGTYTAHLTGVTAGSATTIHATLGGSSLTSTFPQLSVVPGPYSLSQSVVVVTPVSITSGAEASAILMARDAAGNAIQSGGLGITFSMGVGGSTVSIGSITDNQNGTYTAQLTGRLAGTALQIKGSIGTDFLTSTAPTIIVTPGAPSIARSTLALAATTVASGSSVTLTLTTRDAEGNLCATGGASVSFDLDGGT